MMEEEIAGKPHGKKAGVALLISGKVYFKK